MRSRRQPKEEVPSRVKITLLITAISMSGFVSGLAAQPGCDPLPPPDGPVVDVTPAEAGNLRGIVNSASTGTTIRLQDGYYDLSGGDSSSNLNFDTPGVILRSASGEPDAVVLDGGYGTNKLISIRASNVVIADLTVMRANHHPIHITGPAGNPIAGMLLHNIKVIDPGQQAIKINPVQDGYVDNGVIQCSEILLTPTGRGHISDNCYTGGIDAHKAWGWVIRRNRIEGFWCDSGLSEHAIHFWNASRDTLIEENLILDNVRGIGLGMREVGPDREYPDDPYPGVGYLGHIDGIVRNNFIAAADPGLFASAAGFDSGITMEQARGTGVYHNSVASTQAPTSSSIEWRWSNTLVDVANNLATDQLKARNGGVAVEVGNLENVDSGWFTDIPTADLHLTEQGQAAVDSGVDLPAGLADTDFDTQARDDLPDVGADESRPAPIFQDGFESGDTSGWPQN